jgi:hypothetical protein
LEAAEMKGLEEEVYAPIVEAKEQEEEMRTASNLKET